MPWSPVPKFPEIIRSVKEKGYSREVSLEVLRRQIMEKTGVFRDHTIKNVLKAMEDLGYIRMKPGGFVWEICQEKPDLFPGANKSPAKEADDLLKKIPQKRDKKGGVKRGK